MDFSFHGSRHVYGLPEHASSLALKNTMYALWTNLSNHNWTICLSDDYERIFFFVVHLVNCPLSLSLTPSLFLDFFPLLAMLSFAVVMVPSTSSRIASTISTCSSSS
jgi:hypothetical protein